jgi:NADH-quinone oxidoreductase subunit E
MSELPSAANTKRLPAAVSDAIDRLRPRYPTSEALLLPARHLAQAHWGGWLSNEAIEAVALELDLAPARVYGVVTFYDLYHLSPVGRHRVRICTNLSCALRGANEVLHRVKQKLGVDEGQVTADGRCSVVHFECLGACEQAPMMMVDDEYVGDLTPESAVQFLEKLT